MMEVHVSWQPEPTSCSLAPHPGSTLPYYSLGMTPGPHSVDSASVLVVDDDAAIRASLGLMLADEGYTVTEARDGVEALHALRQAALPTVVVLDIMMPRLTGEEVLMQVLGDQRLSMKSAFVVITANAQSISATMRQRLSALGIPVILKPVDIETILDEVGRARNRLPPSA
jgi:CheY-like chemotaxis protein